ncbi:serine/threonine-protein phosphatase [Erysipelothrix sp. HDW6C]|uniref:PP2C family protein-serine/threonine phosphatase n=1 Tax=Erysipelothrix sp. HDW6C TaxID=2714930 RepID=UPI0014094565|nr:protein phosphatase 2C domain-containing protein [Erysipelothrix sp. HDW6C]QIK70229.1 serine/threonine-protein phosphatase [Erysipelothrix sp. HDW6C]
MKYTSISEIGLLRKDNQDFVAVVENNNALLAIVCDGIGGANAGAVASQMVVRMIRDAFLEVQSFIDTDEVMTWFNRTITEVNKAAYHESLVVPEYNGMGTTLVACVILAGEAIAFNIGDSRIYRYEGETLQVLSHDQTYAYEMYLRNEISLEEVDEHPKRNVLMNAVGIDERISYETIHIEKGWDYLLMSSDGLHGYVPHLTIEETMKKDKILEIRNRLMELSYQAGGYDNISIILVEGD